MKLDYKSRYGHERTKKSQKNNNEIKKARRERALNRLINQLETGIKKKKDLLLPLTPDDIKRINKEIAILKERL